MPGDKYLHIRVTDENLARMKRGAQLTKTSLTYFATMATLRMADLVVEKHEKGDTP